VAASRVIAEVGGGKANLLGGESFHGPNARDRSRERGCLRFYGPNAATLYDT
jgi:hypothetical protein